jgi:hypothetical protein
MRNTDIEKTIKIAGGIILSAVIAFFFFSISSCGKGNEASPEGLNIEYEVFNLSPDIFQLDLFVNNAMVNSSPFVFNQPQGYFYVPSVVIPYQIRSAINTGDTWFSLNDVLTPGAKYTLYVTGNIANNTQDTLLTVDTALTPPLGHGGIRFVNVSPTAAGGLDMYLNGTRADSAILYRKYSIFTTVPVGNYDVQIDATGTKTILNEMPTVTVQDGRLYTIYAYGYSTRTDTAAFSAGIVTNR